MCGRHSSADRPAPAPRSAPRRASAPRPEHAACGGGCACETVASAREWDSDSRTTTTQARLSSLSRQRRSRGPSAPRPAGRFCPPPGQSLDAQARRQGASEIATHTSKNRRNKPQMLTFLVKEKLRQIFKNPHPRCFFIDLQGEGRGVGGGETSISCLPFVLPPRIQPATWACALPRTWTPTFW